MYEILRKAIALTIACVGFSNIAVAEIRCSCRSIPADGEGNTSCSANEIDGRCTIDYNLFGDRETQAANVLTDILDFPFESLADTNTETSLLAAERGDFLFDQVFLYLNVAAVSQDLRFYGTVREENVRALRALTDRFSDSIVSAFRSSTRALVLKRRANFPREAFVTSDNLIISPGCVEASVGEQWVMFKASWALFAKEPRCAEDDRWQ